MTTITATTPAPVVADEAVVIPDAIIANANELYDVRAALKVLNEREDALKRAVRGFLESAGLDAATNGIVSIFRSEYERKGVDRKKLEALYPSVLKDVGTTTDVVQIRVEVK
jgi:hypothetical protein